MKNKMACTYLIVGLVSVLASCKEKALPSFTLQMTFDGMIAFVPTTLDAAQVVWALLPNADYDPTKYKDSDFPPHPEQPPTGTRLGNFPRHIAALRFRGAIATLNGTRINGLVPALLFKGSDLRLTTGKPALTSSNLDLLVNAKILADARGGTADSFKDYDIVDSKYIAPDSTTALSQPNLGARVLINFGDSLSTKTLTCSGKPRLYGFSKSYPNDCAGKTPLGETVVVSQSGLTQPVTIAFAPSSDTLTLEPLSPGGMVTVEILNVPPEFVADPFHNACDDNLASFHPHPFRWFYGLLKNVPPDPALHFVPCVVQGAFGGSKCPQKALIP